MQSYNQTVKSKTVPVFITICGVAIIGSAIIGLNTSQSAKIQDNKNNTKSVEVVDVDKAQLNRDLNELQFALSYALDGQRSVKEGEGSLLRTDTEKIRFAFMTVSYKGNNTRMKRNMTPEGYEITGYLGVDRGYFIDFYQDLFHAGVNEDLLENLFEEKDGYIYGSIMSGIVMGSEIYKVNKVTKDGDNYEVLIDVLPIGEDGEAVKYFSESVTEYPESLVGYQIKVNVTKGTEVYTINSMVA